MSKLVSSLVSDAKKDAERIVKSAESEVDRIVSEEKAKRAILLKNAEEECEHSLSEQKRERIAWARLEARRLTAEAKEDAIKSVLDEMHGMLNELKKSEDYSSFMKSAVAQASAEFGSGEELVLHVVKGDRKYAGKFKGKVLEDLDAAGGLIVERADGKVCVNFTLESVLDNKKDELRKKIHEKLFGA
ncbi:MAG: V-type ATP synthase subunit E, partial [Candidatus Micrarchaeia archaeon]